MCVFDVVGLGLNAVDLFARVPRLPETDEKLSLDEPFVRCAGGQVATALVTCQRLGLSTCYLGKIGDDQPGGFSRQSLIDEGVDVSHLQVIPGATTQQAMIFVDTRSGERTILYHRDARTQFELGDYSPELVTAGRVLLLDGHEQLDCSIQAARSARAAGIPVVLDAEKPLARTAELLSHVDYLLCNQRFPSAYTGVPEPEKALRILSRGPQRLVSMTLGQGGSLAICEGQLIRTSGFAVDHVLDTTGAGDVFHGAFIVALLRDWPLEQMLSYANACAALSCQGLGGRTAIPTEERIQALMGRGKL